MCVPLLVLVLPNWGFGSSQLHWQVILQLHLLVLTHSHCSTQGEQTGLRSTAAKDIPHFLNQHPGIITTNSSKLQPRRLDSCYRRDISTLIIIAHLNSSFIARAPGHCPSLYIIPHPAIFASPTHPLVKQSTCQAKAAA